MYVQRPSYGYPMQPIVPVAPHAPGVPMPVAPVPTSYPPVPYAAPVAYPPPGIYPTPIAYPTPYQAPYPAPYPAPVSVPVYAPQGHGWVIDRFQGAVDWAQDALQRLRGLVGQPAPAPTPPTPEKPKPEPKPTPKPEPKPAPKPAPKPDPKPVEGRGPTLRKGSRGEGVKRLQARLAELGFDPGPHDGDFGPKTKEAVRRFQQAKGLTADGIVGPQTWAKLGIVVAADSVGSAGPGGMVRVQGHLMKPKAADAFNRMATAARKAGINLEINSAYRSDAEQARMFQAAVRKYGSYNAARKWVAPPGTSTHRTGYAIDIDISGASKGWLARNAGRFGFYRPYSWEPWHFEVRR